MLPVTREQSSVKAWESKSTVCRSRSLLLNTRDFALLTGNSERYEVVAGRGKFDEETVDRALQEQSAYVGLVASKKRCLEILRSLEGNAYRKAAGKKFMRSCRLAGEGTDEVGVGQCRNFSSGNVVRARRGMSSGRALANNASPLTLLPGKRIKLRDLRALVFA